jgi:hypothetical protein
MSMIMKLKYHAKMIKLDNKSDEQRRIVAYLDGLPPLLTFGYDVLRDPEGDASRSAPEEMLNNELLLVLAKAEIVLDASAGAAFRRQCRMPPVGEAAVPDVP